MKVLVATKITQGQRESDFFWTTSEEFVKFDSECDSDKNNIDGGCGCRRGFSGFKTLKATTTAKVISKDITKEEYTKELEKSLEKSGYMKFLKQKDVEIEATELLKIADVFKVGDIIEKRGTKIQVRIPK